MSHNVNLICLQDRLTILISCVCLVRTQAQKVTVSNSPVILSSPTTLPNNVAVIGVDGVPKTTQAGMSGIQALAAAAAATQKITIAPQSSQIKIGNYRTARFRIFLILLSHSSNTSQDTTDSRHHHPSGVAREATDSSKRRRYRTKGRAAAPHSHFGQDQYWDDSCNCTQGAGQDDTYTACQEYHRQACTYQFCE